jgi:hypothetical protein
MLGLAKAKMLRTPAAYKQRLPGIDTVPALLTPPSGASQLLAQQLRGSVLCQCLDVDVCTKHTQDIWL